jgi:hypothetical protein
MHSLSHGEKLLIGTVRNVVEAERTGTNEHLGRDRLVQKPPGMSAGLHRG